jgi:hypothetical protein
MKRKSDIGTWILIIFFIGLVSSLINSDIPFAAIIENWGSIEIEATLEYLNIGLAFVAFGFLLFFIISRLGRQEKDKSLKSLPEENRESE